MARQRSGQKGRGFGGKIFACPPVLGGGWVCVCRMQPHKSEFGFLAAHKFQVSLNSYYEFKFFLSVLKALFITTKEWRYEVSLQ